MVRDWPAMLAVGAGIFVAMATASSHYYLPVVSTRAVALALPLSVPWSDKGAIGQPAVAQGDGVGKSGSFPSARSAR